MGRLKRIWNSKEIKINTKIQINNTIIIPQILYGSETWETKEEDEKQTTHCRNELPMKNS